MGGELEGRSWEEPIACLSPRHASRLSRQAIQCSERKSRRGNWSKSNVRAVIQPGYGSPDILELREVQKPSLKDGEVLVRVAAASVSAGDWHLLRGKPYLMRPFVGLFKPRSKTPGQTFAGRVEKIGNGVTQVRAGDEVFGWTSGAFAEYVCDEEEHFLPVPANLVLEQAAAIGDSAVTALKALRDHGKVEPGQKVLVNGASGGVGTFAVQIAKSFGADVTAVCSTRNVDMVRSIGADQVIDYTNQDFADGEQRYDLMLDMVGNRSLSDCRRALTPHGTYILVGTADAGRVFGLSRQFKAMLLTPFVGQKLRTFIAFSNRDDLDFLSGLASAGKLTPVLDKRYELSEISEALRHQGEGHTQGKIIITM